MAKAHTKSWWEGGGEPYYQEQYEHALNELQELKDLRRAAKIGLLRRLSRGE